MKQASEQQLIISPRISRMERRRRELKRKWTLGTVCVLGAALTLFGLGQLLSYGVDLIRAQRASQEMRQAYYAEPDEQILLADPWQQEGAEETTWQEAMFSVTEAQASEENHSAEAEFASSLFDSHPAPSPTQTLIPRLRGMGYPENARLSVSKRFRQLRKESKYIVGWLSIDKVIDEPVAQRNNTFYLNHDIRGKENVNGALFLDASISLKTRPYTCMIYGHNMKSGAMFGGLRNYENITFYHKAPLITFDTLYEEGKYIVFSVGNVSTESRGKHFVDFYALKSTKIPERQEAIAALQNASIYTSAVDVTPEDQLLVLVTCVENEEERRVVAARRVRAGEEVESLEKMVRRSWKK